MRDYQGGSPGAGLRTTVAEVVAVVLVHPDPLVAILALVTVSVFLPLYAPVTFTDPLGAAVIVQLDRMLDLKVAPSFGTTRVSVVFVPVSSQLPVVLIVLRPARIVLTPIDGRWS